MAVLDFFKKKTGEVKEKDGIAKEKAELEEKKSDNLLEKKETKKKEKTGELRKEEKKKFPKGRNGLRTFLIIKPRLSEKTTFLEANGHYVFDVLSQANKTEIKKEIENIYNVKVEKVNIINLPGKKRKWRNKISQFGKRKKAEVILKQGYKIETGV